MGKAGKLRKSKAQARLKTLKKEIKKIAGDEAKIKKRAGSAGHLGMDAILEEINRQLETPTSTSGVPPTSTHGSLGSIRDLIEIYQRVESMITSFNDELSDESLQVTGAMDTIEGHLTYLEKQTGLAKEQPGLTEKEIVKRNVLARIDKLNDDVDTLEREITLPDNEFENPTVKLKGAIERAKTKIAYNRALVEQGKTNETDDEKERAILRWEIEINKIEKQIKDVLAVARTEPIDSELNTYIAQYQKKLGDAKDILKKVKGDGYPVYLSEVDSSPIRNVLSEFNLAEIMRKAISNVEPESGTHQPTPEGQVSSGDEFDELFGIPTSSDMKDVKSNLNEDELSQLLEDILGKTTSSDGATSTIEQQRQFFLKKVAELAAEKNIDALTILDYPLLFGYEKEIPKLFTGQYSKLGTELSIFLKAVESIQSSQLNKDIPQDVKNAYQAFLAELPDEFKNQLPAQLSEQPQNVAKSTSTQSDTPQAAEQTLTKDQTEWLELCVTAAKSLSINEHTRFVSYDFLVVPDINCIDAFSGDLAYIGVLAQAFYEACSKVPELGYDQEFPILVEEAKKAYNSFIEALPQPLKSEFKFPEKFEANTPSVTSKTSSTVRMTAKVKSTYITLDGRNKLLFDQLKDEIKKSNPNVKSIDKLINDLIANKFAEGHELIDRLRDLQLEFLTLGADKTSVAPETYQALSKYIESLAMLEEVPTLDIPLDPNNIQNTKVDTDTTTTQEIERLRATVERLHQEASNLLDEPNRKLTTIQTLLAGKSESQQRKTSEKIDECKVKLESLRTRLAEIGKMEDMIARSKAYEELMRNTTALSEQIARIEVDVKPAIKKTNRVDTDEADLRKHPSDIKIADPEAQISIGDMHGNTMKLIHFLIQQGVMELESSDQYAELLGIYEIFNDENAYKPEMKDNLKGLLTSYQGILSRAKIIDPAPTLRLIGDELADRGANDYLTLKVLEKLSEAGTNVEILMSNHSMEFLAPIEEGKEKAQLIVKQFSNPDPRYKVNQGQSGVNLYRLIDLGIIEFSEVQKMVEDHYKKFTRALSYTLSEDQKEITIFSHAAIGMKQLVDIAEALGIQNVKTPESAVEIAKLIDVIVDEMMKRVLNNTLHELNYREENNPIGFLFWNREYAPELLDRKPTLANGDKCNWAHGHDSDDPLQYEAHIKMLDSYFGKSWSDRYLKTSDQIQNPVLTTYGTSPKLALAMTQEQRARQEQERVAKLEKERTEAKADDKVKVSATISNTENLRDILSFIKIIDEANPGFDNNECIAAVRKLGHETNLDASELKEFLVAARNQAFELAKKIAFTAIEGSTDNENIMKLLLCDPQDFTNNQFKDALSRIIKNDDVMVILDKNKSDLDFTESLKEARDNIRVDIIKKAAEVIFAKPKDDIQIKALSEEENEAQVKQALTALLGDDLYKQLLAVDPSENDLHRLTEAAWLVEEGKPELKKDIEDLIAIIEEIDDVAQLKNLSILLKDGATLDDREVRTAFANLLKVNPTDQEDLRIEKLIDAEADLNTWFGSTLYNVFGDLARKAAIEIIQNKDGKPANYADLLGEYIEEVNDDEDNDEVEKKLKAIIGEEMVEHLKLADIELSDFKEIAQEVLAPISLDAAMTNLATYDGNANEFFNFINALGTEPENWTKDQEALIDKVLKDDSENLRYNLVASECDLSQIIQLAKNKLAPLAITAAKDAVTTIPATGAGYDPKTLIDFIKSATIAPPDPTRFDKLKTIIDPVLVEQLKTAGIDDLSVIATQAKDKLREYASDVMLNKLQTANEADLEKLISEPNTIHGVSPSFKEIISNISGIANLHEIIELTGTGNINQLLDQLKAQRLNTRTSSAIKAATSHIQTISNPVILAKLAELDKTQFIDTTNVSKLINPLGPEAGKYLPALISANPKLKFDIIVEAAERRLASLNVIKLQQKIGLFQGSRATVMQLHKARNLEERLAILVNNGVITSSEVPQLNNIHAPTLLKAINDSAKQWITDNLVKSAKTTIDGIKEIDQLPMINNQADLEKLGFKPEEMFYLFDPADLDRIKLVIEQRKEAIALTAGTPSKKNVQLHDVHEFISNRATISDLQALQTAVSAGDEAKCKKALKRRGFTDESLSELKIAEFQNLTALISSQLHEMQLQDTATKSAKHNFEHCSAVLEETIRDRDELQRQVDEQTAIISDDDAEDDAKIQAQEELEELEPILETVKSKVTLARSDLNHARERFETADTITKDKENRLHQAELHQLQELGKQAERKVEDRKKLVKAVTDAEAGVSRATTAETEAKRLLDDASAPKKPSETDEEFNARQVKIPDLTTKHADKQRELTEVKRVKTEAERVLTDARALKSDTDLQTELAAANETVVVHRNQQPPKINDESKKKAKRQLENDDVINENATRTDLDERKNEAKEALSKATKRESKLIARKGELETLLASNPSHSIKQAAKTELTQLQTALETVRKQINAEEALIEGTKPTATTEDRKKLEVESKHTADEANTCMRNYKQAQKYTKDKISIAKHVLDNYMGNSQMLDSLHKLSDNYIVQLEYHAKRGHDENAKDELNAILDKSAKLHSQLEIFKDELNKKILDNVANKENLLEILKKVNAILMAIEQAQQAYRVPLAVVGSLCKVSNSSVCSTEDDINNQIAAIIGALPGTSTCTLSSSIAKINTTATFKDAAGRVTSMELEDGRALRKGTFNAAVVQKCTPEGGFVTIFHVNESDKARITGNTSLTAGAKLIEEHRLGNHNSSDPIDIIGKFPPQMVKDMIAYCEAQGYKYNNLTDTKYTPSAKSISALQAKLDTEKTKIAIFGTAKELGTSKAKITELEKEIKLDETPTPTSTRPTT